MYIRSPKELGLYVLAQRKKLNLSQTDLGKLVGLKQKTISAFENHPESAQIETLFRILAAINSDLELMLKNNHNNAVLWDKEW